MKAVTKGSQNFRDLRADLEGMKTQLKNKILTKALGHLRTNI